MTYVDSWSFSFSLTLACFWIADAPLILLYVNGVGYDVLLVVRCLWCHTLNLHGIMLVISCYCVSSDYTAAFKCLSIVGGFFVQTGHFLFCLCFFPCTGVAETENDQCKYILADYLHIMRHFQHSGLQIELMMGDSVTAEREIDTHAGSKKLFFDQWLILSFTFAE